MSAALAQVRLSPLPGVKSLGACVTLTRLQRPSSWGDNLAELKERDCFHHFSIIVLVFNRRYKPIR